MQLENEVAFAAHLKDPPLTNKLVILRGKTEQTTTITKEDRSTCLNICHEGDCGNGTFTDKDGMEYMAKLKREKEGKGKLASTNGYTYEGEWLNGKMNGKGSMSFANGNRHAGNFVNGELEGEVSVCTRATNSTAIVMHKKGKQQQ